MEKKVYFILILCGILSQGICNLYQEHLLIRKKRIEGGIPSPLQDSPYLVHVLSSSGNYQCPASLLTADVAISSATCFVSQNTQNMTITSRSRDGAHLHQIVKVIFLDPNFNWYHWTNKNIVLVRFAQAINFQTSLNRPIAIYNGYLPGSRLLAHVYSWDKPRYVGNRKIPSENIRSLSVLIISYEYCQHVYPNIIHPGNICANGNVPGERCHNRDAGAPLVMDNKLLGIFVYYKPTRPSNPNIFMNLLDHDIRRWIHQHVPSLHLF